MKELKIEVPKGYVIDKENSTFECIKFKKKEEIKTWEDLYKESVNAGLRIEGYFISSIDNEISFADSLKANYNNRHIFLSKKEAISARAAAMISQLMPYYGGAITDEEWEDDTMYKHIIRRIGSRIDDGYNSSIYYNLLAFRTPKLKDEFLENNEQLVKDYLMID